uniref:Exosome complex component RRP41 n=1 Tax=Tetraselmis sp. GSL018 TaxID=582737 RepID=A0A061RIF6_9CHLO|mmetsp:Transcript_37699/g.89545  ORF Transcript_37699/g.89545 Transcript_37699/m.89545 type:complete len:248 (-) Transcript_37699:177-920(-)|eukprot:CAMPEP_0177585424 /NCGR_PEP_ID=MMETSP0419_2-20121207/4486_1 /TAXON_ID=582737 /ORGANISM="Tetraselmis sp., Strain GSL018" /LENGTH=247 /DNA_ID=CAMNT_0019075157 /DNA_START=60 /DNA_END=803 /DNA_ORIENTATION=+
MVLEYVSPEGLRVDGRRPKELRALSAGLGTLESADGSATFQMGNTKVMASVFGPRETVLRSQEVHDRATLSCECAMAPFSTGGDRRRRGKSDRLATELTMVVRETLKEVVLLELLPRSQIDVCVQVLQADGGVRGACLNAAMLALVDAGIPCRDLLAACSAGFLDGTPLLDLNHTEDAGGGPEVAVALETNLEKVVLLQMDHKMGREDYEAVLHLATEGCRAVGRFMRQMMLEHTRTLASARGAVQL